MSTTELFERRRENLNKIIDQWIATARFKTGKEICEHYGLSAAYVAQLLNSKRQIGEKAARELEQQLGLEPLCLDQQEVAAESQVKNVPALYSMQTVEQELFRLHQFELNNYQISSLIQLQPQHYVVKVSGEYYLPILKPEWWLVCDSQQRPTPQDLLCVQLINELCLILQLYNETEQELHCQSLNGKRQVRFQKQDILQADVVIAILSPQQFQLQ
ncbi:hypothetical protein ABEF85_12350 [Acinetobacter thermotolerans]|uniref:hypothetical protein n=1 Tax=Acinetobacter thermotolerans TaxID=3151487 RepID=UPI00325B0CE1